MLEYSIIHVFTDLLAKQLEVTGADINHRDDSNRTALHVAASKDYLEAAIYLISIGADLQARDNRGETPLHEAAWGILCRWQRS